MNEQEQIAFGNLQGEVRFLATMVRHLAGRTLPTSPDARAALLDAIDAERKKLKELSPERISFDHAVNTWRPHDWIGHR